MAALIFRCSLASSVLSPRSKSLFSLHSRSRPTQTLRCMRGYRPSRMALPSIGPKVGMTLATSIAFEQKDGNKLHSCWTRVCITFFTTFVTPSTLAARSHWSARTKIYSLNTFNFTSLELVHSTCASSATAVSKAVCPTAGATRSLAWIPRCSPCPAVQR